MSRDRLLSFSMLLLRVTFENGMAAVATVRSDAARLGVEYARVDIGLVED
jgi:hypothetical protein